MRELYRALFEDSQSIMLLIDPQTGDLEDANEQASRFYGYSRDILRSMNISQLNIFTQDEIRSEMDRANAEKKSFFNFRHRLADGSIRDVEVYSGPINIGEKKFLYSIVHDVSERVRLEQTIANQTRRLEASEILLREILDTMEKAIAVYQQKGDDYIIVHMNEFGEKITRVKKEDILGKSILDVYPEAAQIGLIDKLNETRDTGKSTYLPRTEYRDNRLRLSIENYLFKLPSGLIVVMFEETTEKKRSENRVKQLLAEKEILLREVHHRIKNNMSVMQSLLSLHQSHMTGASEISAMGDAISRISTMMVLYDKLYRSGDYNHIVPREYIEQLAGEIKGIFPESQGISIETDIEDIEINPRVIFNLGIIINELLTNTCKYAFDKGGEGTIRIQVYFREERLHFLYEDNGRGFTETGNAGGFGSKLIELMAEQMEANLDISTKRGVCYHLTLQIQEQ